MPILVLRSNFKMHKFFVRFLLIEPARHFFGSPTGEYWSGHAQSPGNLGVAPLYTVIVIYIRSLIASGELHKCAISIDLR